MPKKEPFAHSQTKQIKQYLSKELLGEIPLFYEQALVKDSNAKEQGGPARYRREIEVSAYQTRAFASRAYHKTISRII